MLRERTPWVRNGSAIEYPIGNVGIPDRLYHIDDTDTYLLFEDDKLTIKIGNEDLITLTEDGTQDIVKLGDGGDVDINLNDDMFIRGSDGFVGIGTTGLDALLRVGSASLPSAGYFDAVGEEGLIVAPNQDFGRVFIQGNTVASLYLSDIGASVDDRIILLQTDGGITKFRSTNDANSAAVVDNILVMEHSTGNVGIGTTGLLAKLHIDQATSDAAIPVLSLDQADVSDGFINFLGATAASAVGPISSWTTGNTIQGFVRVEINNAQYWMPYYDAPTS